MNNSKIAGVWVKASTKPKIDSDDYPYFLIYGCKHGDIKNDVAGHYMIASWNGKYWENSSHGGDIEDNSDYWLVTHWKNLTPSPLDESQSTDELNHRMNPGYWQKRCEAAEKLIDKETAPRYKPVAFNAWQQLKSNPSVVPVQEGLKDLIEANELIRSFYSVAVRYGKDTNWDALCQKIESVLGKQHKILHP